MGENPQGGGQRKVKDENVKAPIEPMPALVKSFVLDYNILLVI